MSSIQRNTKLNKRRMTSNSKAQSSEIKKLKPSEKTPTITLEIDWVKARQQQLRDCLTLLNIIEIKDIYDMIVQYCHGWVWVVTSEAANQEFLLDPLQLVDEKNDGKVIDLIPVPNYDERKQVLFDGLYRYIRQTSVPNLSYLQSVVNRSNPIEAPIYWSDLVLTNFQWDSIQHIYIDPSTEKSTDKTVLQERLISSEWIQPRLLPFHELNYPLWMASQDIYQPTIFHQDYPKEYAEWNGEDISGSWYNDPLPKACLYDMYCISLSIRTPKSPLTDGFQYSHLYGLQQPRNNPCSTSDENKPRSIELQYRNKHGRAIHVPRRIQNQQSNRWIAIGDAHWFRFPCDGNYRLTVNNVSIVARFYYAILEIVDIRKSKNQLRTQYRIDPVKHSTQTISIVNCEHLLASFQFNRYFDSLVFFIEQI